MRRSITTGTQSATWPCWKLASRYMRTGSSPVPVLSVLPRRRASPGEWLPGPGSGDSRSPWRRPQTRPRDHDLVFVSSVRLGTRSRLGARRAVGLSLCQSDLLVGSSRVRSTAYLIASADRTSDRPGPLESMPPVVISTTGANMSEIADTASRLTLTQQFYPPIASSIL
jgi:hypothetical protein